MSVITWPSTGVYPSTGLYPSSGLDVQVCRERPPLRLAIDVETPDGKHYRWGPDEHNAANVAAGLSFSTTMPGGFEQATCTLARKPGLDYPDLAEYSTITAYGAGGEIAWQGRLQTSPRTSGDQIAITPGAVGYQAHLDDDKSARMPYIDINLANWAGASTQRKLTNAIAGNDTDDAAQAPDPVTGNPSLETHFTGAWSRQHQAEGWYDARGLDVGALYYAWEKNAAIDHTLAEWIWTAFLSPDAVAFPDTSGNLKAAGPGFGSLATGGTGRKWALVQLVDSIASGADGVDYAIFWTALAVLGNHGLTPRGTWNGTAGSIGFYASDVIAHAVSTWAPKLALGTIETTAFVIPHLAYLDSTTAGNIVKDVLQYELQDWWVDEGGSARTPTFQMASRGNHGRDWRARVGPSGLQETGPQVDRMCNRVLVAYRDVLGATRTVGPTGSSADTIDDSLADTDPANPVTAAGLVVYPPSPPTLGTSTAPAAIRVGQAFLAQQRQLSTAGQASIVGDVEDDHGVLWPAWAMRAGDRVTFVDAHDPVARHIAKASYSESSKTCQLDLDSPPEGLAALIARMGSVLAPLGFS